MSLIRDDAGGVWALMECPHCEVYEQHQETPDRQGTFQCRWCFAMFAHSA